MAHACLRRHMRAATDLLPKRSGSTGPGLRPGRPSDRARPGRTSPAGRPAPLHALRLLHARPHGAQPRPGRIGGTLSRPLRSEITMPSEEQHHGPGRSITVGRRVPPPGLHGMTTTARGRHIARSAEDAPAPAPGASKGASSRADGKQGTEADRRTRPAISPAPPQATSNLSSLIAAKSVTSPPTRRVA